jgi:predicted secreted protein
MSTFTGQDGSLSIGGNAIAELRSFSVDHTTNTIENTVMTQDSRTYKGGLKEWSGSADIYYSTTVGNISALLSGNVVALIAYPAGNVSTYPKMTGNIIVTGLSVNSTVDGMVESSISFSGTGDLTVTTAS